MNDKERFWKEKVPSMKRRSFVNNYNGPHVYMLTLVVEGRRPLLGRLAGHSDGTADSDEAPRVVFSPLGEAVYQCWRAIPQHHPEVQLIAFQMMPDHLHGVLRVKEDMQQHLGQVVSGFKAGCNKAYRRLFAEALPQHTPSHAHPATIPPLVATSSTSAATSAPTPAPSTPAPPSSPPLAPPSSPPVAPPPAPPVAPPSASSGGARGSACAAAPPVAPPPASSGGAHGSACAAALPVAPPPASYGGARGSACAAAPPVAPASSGGARGSACAAALPQRDGRDGRNDRPRGLLFERGYNDLIAKGYDMLPRLIAYVKDNPRRLLLKREHPDLFRVRFGLRVGTQSYAAIGNRFLLQRPERLQVQLSRHYTDDEISRRTRYYLDRARQGAVLVSPAISPGEQRVMRAALDAGLPLIYLSPRSFNSFTRPGQSFLKACADGHLLILAPWEHHTGKVALTRDMCLALNVMAQEICTADS